MRERTLNLNVRVTDEERAKLHRLAADRDLSASTLLRHMLRELYAQRFGNEPPPVDGLPGETSPKPRKRGRR